MSKEKKLYVLKRDGREQEVHFYKITERIKKLCEGLNKNFIDESEVTLKVINGLYAGVTTVELDNFAAEICATLASKHPDYETLAARIAISNLHKETDSLFSGSMTKLYNYINKKTGMKSPMISEEIYKIILDNKDRLDKAVVQERDFEYTYFGFKTLEKSYLLKIDRKPVERPQYLIMRVAVGIHGDDIESAIETYNLMSERWFTHATPTLFNAGTNRPQLSSCFLLSMKEDSLEGIYDTLKQCALISKSAGGIGLAVHCVRAAGSAIAGTNGESRGLLPMLRVFNTTASYVDQGGNKRPGAFAMYLEPWHADIFDYLNCRKNSGVEEKRTRSLFFALWVPDLFMERVEADANWTLMCPATSPGLHLVWGDQFKELYETYERQGKGKAVIKARKLWHEIVTAQIETGVPYMLYKDACNKKSNQQNLGTIVSSNLCTEVVQYSDANEVAVCNLASVALSQFVTKDKKFDISKLEEVVGVVTKNLNRIIDINYYPIPQAHTSNMRHRPIGIGVQGLADVFMLMRFPFDSIEARKLNRDIFETIYFSALKASCQLAEKFGTYETYEGSPVSKGILQPDMWGITPSNRHDWSSLRADIKKHGVRNSLLVAPMPTASTAQILGNCECFEPYTSNIYTRRVTAGEHQVVNHHLLRDLMRLDLWNADMKNKILANSGSIQNIDEIPENIKALYRTVWEIPQKSIIDMAADRGPYIDQSQSLNIHIAQPSYDKITSMHFYGWKKGLKTGMYYLRSRPAVDPIKFTVDASKLNRPASRSETDTQTTEQTPMDQLTCSRLNKDACMMCSG